MNRAGSRGARSSAAGAGDPDAGYAGLVLAAGASTRMGSELNKLLIDVEGAPLVTRPIDALLAAGVSPLVVVLGHQAERVRETIEDRPCEPVEHAGWAQGMGASLAFGVRALGDRAGRGLLVCVADLPGLEAASVEALIAADRALGDDGSADPERICVPVHDGRRGHPVLFGAGWLEALARLEGDVGGRALIESARERVVEVEVDSPGVLQDIDRPEDLAAWRRTRETGPSGGDVS